MFLNSREWSFWDQHHLCKRDWSSLLSTGSSEAQRSRVIVWMSKSGEAGTWPLVGLTSEPPVLQGCHIQVLSWAHYKAIQSNSQNSTNLVKCDSFHLRDEEPEKSWEWSRPMSPNSSKDEVKHFGVRQTWVPASILPSHVTSGKLLTWFLWAVLWAGKKSPSHVVTVGNICTQF